METGKPVPQRTEIPTSGYHAQTGDSRSPLTVRDNKGDLSMFRREHTGNDSSRRRCDDGGHHGEEPDARDL